MKTSSLLLRGALVTVLTIGSGSSQVPWTTARAEAQVLRSRMVGTWYQMDKANVADVDTYTFRSNGTYIFRAGLEKGKSGNVAHSGTWQVINRGRTLLLFTKRRTVLSAGKRITIPASRTFQLPLKPIGNGVLIDGFAFSQ